MSGQIIGPIGVLPTAGAGVSFSYKTNGVGGGGTSVSITLGAGVTTISSDITVMVVSNDAAASTGVTIGGNAMTAVTGATDTSGVDQLVMYYLSGVVLSGTTAVVVTSGSSMTTVGCQVGVISGSATPTPASGSAIAASFNDPFTTGARTVPNGGIMIVHGALADPNTLTSPSNWTIDNGMSRGGSRNEYFGHTALGTGSTITATAVTGGNQNHGITGVWSP